jgi:hypothetical protein
MSPEIPASADPTSAFHPSAVETVRDLRERFPDTPFLTLGQTVLWDEPTKAAFCKIVEAVAPGTPIVAAVHDTDYFAKLPLGIASEDAAPFAILEHNDGDTRGLWSAAGEISSLLGGENVPTRAFLTHNGVAFDRVARRYPGGESALLNTETAAWGWRALVHTQPHPRIAAEVRLEQVLGALKEQISWAFAQSYEIAPAPRAQFDVGAQVLAWVDEYSAQNPKATLSDLYRWLTPKLWCMARGGGGCNLETSTSMELFRFNRETCGRARFRIVDAFLNPATRQAARECYNEAVAGSGIYTLDGFGVGALPFDVVVPGRGRGTLRLENNSVWIQTEDPIELCSSCACESVFDLADLLERELGPSVALVGKAVSLISMLAAEFIFVFHEKASSYTERTQKLNDCLRARGITLKLHPMLRLRYATWDALADTETTLHLPPHFAQAFGSEAIAASEFSARWKEVCDQEDSIVEELKKRQSPRELMLFLSQSDASWAPKLEEYGAARERFTASRDAVQVLAGDIEALKSRVRNAKARVSALEKEKGDDFRARVRPLQEKIFDIRQAQAARLNPTGENGAPKKLSKEERAAQVLREEAEEAEVARLKQELAWLAKDRTRFDEEIRAALQESRSARQEEQQKVAQKLEIERSPEMRQAREEVRALQYEAELARLRRVRDAFAVASGLRQTDLRPTAWWFPLVSPDSRWFHALAQTAQARLEEL